MWQFLRLVQGYDIMDHLEIVASLMRCADQKYVTFDLDKVKDSMKDAKITKQGI